MENPRAENSGIGKNRNLGIFHLVVLIVLGGGAMISFRAAAQADGFLKVFMLDVGQGDAILIQAPGGNQVLIDGGLGEAVLGQLSKILPPTDRSLDVIVVSHPHLDHLGGLPAVLEQYEVGIVLEAREDYDSSIFRTWRQGVKAENARQIEAVAGTLLDLGNGATLTVIYPFKSTEGILTRTPHEHNVTVLLRYGQTEMVFTGDMETKAEAALLAAGLNLNAEVLKIGHHGSKTSTSPEFLEAVSPQVALISAGRKNRYGHPDPLTLKRLEDFGVPYYRTDTQGLVTLTSDGERFTVKTQK